MPAGRLPGAKFSSYFGSNSSHTYLAYRKIPSDFFKMGRLSIVQSSPKFSLSLFSIYTWTSLLFSSVRGSNMWGRYAWKGSKTAFSGLLVIMIRIHSGSFLTILDRNCAKTENPSLTDSSNASKTITTGLILL